jgi:hypothetical protein
VSAPHRRRSVPATAAPRGTGTHRARPGVRRNFMPKIMRAAIVRQFHQPLRILGRFAALLTQRTAGRRRFTYIDHGGGQDCIIGCSTPEQLEQLREKTGLEAPIGPGSASGRGRIPCFRLAWCGTTFYGALDGGQRGFERGPWFTRMVGSARTRPSPSRKSYRHPPRSVRAPQPNSRAGSRSPHRPRQRQAARLWRIRSRGGGGSYYGAR